MLLHHIEGKDNKTFWNHLFLSRYLTEKMTRRAEKEASRALFTPSEGKKERGKNAGYEAELGIFYPHFSRKSKKNRQKEDEKSDEIPNIPREEYRINKTKQK